MMRLGCDEQTANSLSNLLLDMFDEDETAISMFEV